VADHAGAELLGESERVALRGLGADVPAPVAGRDPGGIALREQRSVAVEAAGGDDDGRGRGSPAGDDADGAAILDQEPLAPVVDGDVDADLADLAKEAVDEALALPHGRDAAGGSPRRRRSAGVARHAVVRQPVDGRARLVAERLHRRGIDVPHVRVHVIAVERLTRILDAGFALEPVAGCP